MQGTPANPPPAPTAGFRLRGTSGVDRGAVFPLGATPVTVSNRILLEPRGTAVMLKAAGGKELLVNGELTSLSLLEPGDTIVTEAGEYKFEALAGEAARNAARLQVLKAVAVVAALACAAATILLPGKKQPQHSPKSPSSTFPPRPPSRTSSPPSPKSPSPRTRSSAKPASLRPRQTNTSRSPA